MPDKGGPDLNTQALKSYGTKFRNLLRRVFRWSLWTFAGIATLFFLWVLVNQIDSPPPKNDFTMADLKPAAFSPKNGYYILLNLPQKAEVDIYSTNFMSRVRWFFDPEMIQKGDYIQRQRDWLRDLVGLDEPAVSLQDGEHWWASIRDKRSELDKQISEFTPILNRYERMLECENVEDFTYPHPHCLFPSLLWTRQATDLYLARAGLQGQAGDWRSAVPATIKTIQFSHRLMQNSRCHILHLLGVIMHRAALRALTDMMNQPDFPPSIYSEVSVTLGSSNVREISIRNALVGKYLYFKHSVQELFPDRGGFIYREDFPITDKSFLPRLTFRPNRTLSEQLSTFQLLINAAEQPICNLKLRLANPMNHTCWWMMNAYGKEIIAQANPSLEELYRSQYLSCALWDLVSLSAGMHACFEQPTGAEEIRSFIASLPMRDPFSGQPYRYNPERQVVYSVGPDGKDSSGHNREGADDVIVGCYLYAR